MSNSCNVSSSLDQIQSSHTMVTSSNDQLQMGQQQQMGNGGLNKNFKSKKLEQNKNKICRDYLKGNCHKKFCNFPHITSPDSLVFCHDYQNSTCQRPKCKFLHYTLPEEEHFRKYGKFPDPLDNENQNNSPFCQDMAVNGHCRHRDQCRMNHQHFEPKWRERPAPYPQMRPYNTDRCNEDHRLRNSYDNHSPQSNDYNREYSLQSSLSSSNNDRLYEPSTIRRFKDDLDIISIIRRFEEEQNMLRRRVEMNELKIAELRASNEYLMSQNTQYRIGSVQCSRIVNPVTVTNTSTQPQAVISAVSMAPVQVQATPIVSIAAPQTQIIASSGPQIALAANTSQGQQLALTQQGLSTLSTSNQTLGPPPQILSTSQITLGPSLAPAPSMGLTINTSQALAMSNATQPIISYPVMTHSILPH